MKPLSFILAAATLSSCVSHSKPVYLGQLRDAEIGSEDSRAYDTLQKAVILANTFLSSSPLADGYPAENAHFYLGVNNIILHLGSELVPRYDLVIPLYRASLPASDNAFMQLPDSLMAANLLRISVVMREIQASGEIDDWLNYALLGADKIMNYTLLGAGINSGWGDKRAELTEQAFYQWQAGL